MADWFDEQGNPLVYDPTEGNRDAQGNLHGIQSIYHYANPGNPATESFSDNPNDKFVQNLDAYNRGDSPYGVSYQSTQGGIDVRPGTNVDNVRQQLQAMARESGATYDESDLNDVLRNVGYSNIGAQSLGTMLGAAAQKYKERATNEAQSGGGGGAGRPSGGGSWSFGSAPNSIQPYQPFTFDPSSVGQSDAFKFRFDKAMEAIKRSGAARGTLQNPQTWKAMADEGSGLAAQEYQAEFDRQAGTYDRNFGTYAWGEEGRYNSQRTNRLDDFGIYDTNRNFDRRVLESDRLFDRGVFESDRSFDYGRNRDTMNDYWRFVDYGYNSARR